MGECVTVQRMSEYCLYGPETVHINTTLSTETDYQQDVINIDHLPTLLIFCKSVRVVTVTEFCPQQQIFSPTTSQGENFVIVTPAHTEASPWNWATYART